MILAKELLSLISHGREWYNSRYNIELRHYGVKGMKWGVRKDKGNIMEDISIPKSLGAKTTNYDILDPKSGRIFHLVEGTRITNVKVFAGKGGAKPLAEETAIGLSEQIGGRPENWQHCKGEAFVDVDGEEYKKEIHWFQEESVGKVKFKMKKDL